MNTTPKNKKPMSKDEVLCFVDIVQSKPILTSKETNATTNKLKEETWASVTAEFNAKCGSTPRQSTQLKLKWDNLKKAARKRHQQIRMNCLKTGGGKPDYIPPDEILDRVSGLLGSTCSGFDVPFGGDGIGVGDGIFMELEGVNTIDLQEATHSNETPCPDIPDSDIDIPYPPGGKKRKNPFENVGGSTYGMQSMSQPLKHKAKKIKADGILERNRAVTKYYEKKTEKLELEIELLKIELANMKKNFNSDI